MTLPVPTDPPEATQPLDPIEGLTPLQSAFVRCYVLRGDGNATAAARDAGYGLASCHAVGYRLLRDQRILSAIRNETLQALGAHVPVALKAMTKLLEARSEFVRQTAASDLLNRAGIGGKGSLQVGEGVRVTISLD
jgi:phage terminase small subunit